jgi:hypothetical protein
VRGQPPPGSLRCRACGAALPVEPLFTLLPVEAVPPAAKPTSPRAAASGQTAPPPSFLANLVASLYLAGRLDNTVVMGATAIGFGMLMLVGGLLGPLVVLAYALVLCGMVVFYWQILVRTASGDDGISWSQPDWGFVDDVLWPVIWVLVASVVCFGPAHWLRYQLATYTYVIEIYVAALLVGGILWPVALMSVAIGRSILFLRPDWLVRCIIGIGPVYGVAWLVVAGTTVVWELVTRLPAQMPRPVIFLAPFLRAAIDLYCGYIVFRTLGLLYRHYQARLPWQL